MAYTTINDPTEHFNTIIYTGTGTSDRPVVGAGFQPDLIWIRPRNFADNTISTDSTRGVDVQLYTNLTVGDDSFTIGVESFDSDGFSVNTWNNVNDVGDQFVSWQWKANGGTTTTNDASATSVGSIDSVYQANTTAGFSIVTYTGTGSVATVAHGLGVKPEWIVIKNRGKNEGWAVYHGANTSAPETDGLSLNSNSATSDSADYWNDVAPTTTTFSVAADDRSGGSYNFVAYVFNSVQGYSKFGGYTGNGNADGPFIYLGFKPAYFLVKATDITQNWQSWDNKRNDYSGNPRQEVLTISSTSQESGNYNVDFLANGVKIRDADGAWNGDGNTYVYMAFAESPFVTSNKTPNNAR